uniref:Uncharacterized protein n=1 Tax=Rhizophora mucronata TaxID=61149 RepID=A0A2P2NAS4_RHIMU
MLTFFFFYTKNRCGWMVLGTLFIIVGLCCFCVEAQNA